MVHTMALYDQGPIAVRYPRGNGTGVALPEAPQQLQIGKGRIVREGKKVAADLRFAKPLDEELIRKLLTSHEVAVTVEEAAIGGFGAHVLTMASDAGLIDAGLKLRTMRLPDSFQDQDKPEKQYEEAGLNADGIVDTVLKALRINSVGVSEAGVA
jgi:1-deoxy-D-xylulose-5-phosphate synthase